MLDYVFLEEAEPDFDDAVAYLNDNYPAITDSFIKAVEDAINDIREFSGWWPVWPEAEDWPEWDEVPKPQSHRLKDYDYRIVYVVIDDIVIIIAVASTKREPGYWRTRVKSL